jgi:hypothetical protein
MLSNLLSSPDLFDEYSRRQYQARLPKKNPFGDEEAPEKFSEFDVFTKVGYPHFGPAVNVRGRSAC